MTLSFAAPEPVLASVSNGQEFPVRRVFCVGRNYADHVKEMGGDAARQPPVFFTAWAETVVSGGTIAYPQATTDYHHEIELVVALKSGGRDLDATAAMDHVFGYGVGLDMTRRDLQAAAKAAAGPWDMAKNVEQSKPVGVLRPAEGFDPGTGAICLTVNGGARQSGDLADQIWPVADIIAHLSRLYTLGAGDLIFTGTPAGVGPVTPGDVLVATIDGLETLTITIGDTV